MADTITRKIIASSRFLKTHGIGRSVLLICANDRTLFRRNFFTRKVIIPTYANGYHKYWNADALIYNGKYFSIPDWRTKKIDEI